MSCLCLKNVRRQEVCGYCDKRHHNKGTGGDASAEDCIVSDFSVSDLVTSWQLLAYHCVYICMCWGRRVNNGRCLFSALNAQARSSSGYGSDGHVHLESWRCLHRYSGRLMSSVNSMYNMTFSGALPFRCETVLPSGSQAVPGDCVDPLLSKLQLSISTHLLATPSTIARYATARLTRVIPFILLLTLLTTFPTHSSLTHSLTEQHN